MESGGGAGGDKQIELRNRRHRVAGCGSPPRGTRFDFSGAGRHGFAQRIYGLERGHGKSTAEAVAGSLDDYADDLYALSVER
jgi:hypothetical protein